MGADYFLIEEAFANKDREAYFAQNPNILLFYQRSCLEVGRGANFHRLVTSPDSYYYQMLMYYSFSGIWRG